MTRKHLLFAIAILLVLGGCYLLFHSLTGHTVESLRKKYPHLQPLTQTQLEQLLAKPTLTWEEWVDTKAALSIHDILFMGWNKGDPLPWFLEAYATPEQLAVAEAEYRKAFEESAEIFKKLGSSVPPTAQDHPKEPPQTQAELDNPHYLDIYEGPQEIGAILAEFDHRYRKSSRRSEMDAAYPKEAWIQAFLDKGGSFRDIYDYDKYMDSRGVLMSRSEDPSVWTSGTGGVRPASTLEAYTDAFIEREIWIQETWKRALRENPDMTGIAIEGDHYLPMRANMTYVRSDGAGGIVSWGGGLSHEDHQNLLRGIEPEGMEVIYIDKDYNITEKPPPWDPNSPDANKPNANQLIEKALIEKALIEKAPKKRLPE